MKILMIPSLAAGLSSLCATTSRSETAFDFAVIPPASAGDSPAMVEFTIATQANRVYRVERSFDLREWITTLPGTPASKITGNLFGDGHEKSLFVATDEQPAVYFRIIDELVFGTISLSLDEVPAGGSQEGLSRVFVSYQHSSIMDDVARVRLIATDPFFNSSTVLLAPTDVLNGLNGENGVFSILFPHDADTGVYKYELILEGPGGSELVREVFSIEVVAGILPVTINTMSPYSGSPGEVVKIGGTGFRPPRVDLEDLQVLFNGVPAEVLSWKESEIVAVVPDGAVTGPIAIELPETIAKSAKVFSVPTELVIVDNGQAEITPLGTISFSSKAQGLQSPEVVWSVNGVPGGNSSVGVIDESGNYHAPPVAPGSSVQIAATSMENPAVSTTRILNFAPVHAEVAPAIVNALTGGKVLSGCGRASLIIAPGEFSKSFRVERIEVEYPEVSESAIAPGYEEAFVQARVKVVTNFIGTIPVKGANLHVHTPVWQPGGTKLDVLIDDGSGPAGTDEKVTTGGDGTKVAYPIKTFDKSIYFTRKAAWTTKLPGDLYPMSVSAVETPTSGFHEGQTLPVRIQGNNFFTSYTRVRIADPALRPYFAVGPVFVSHDGDELGFTLRSLPHPGVGGSGQAKSLPVAFRIERLDKAHGLNLVAGVVTTDAKDFVITALPELDVVVDPGTKLFTVDGTPVDATSEGGRFSRLTVAANATLGVGREVGVVTLGNGVTADLSNINTFENQFGNLPHIVADEPLRSTYRIFHPLNSLATFNVTGPIRIDGNLCFSGMRGGEFSTPDDYADSLGLGRLGGFAGGHQAGGIGGNGGVNQDEQTEDGQIAGGNPEGTLLGVGYGASGQRVLNVPPARFGSRVDPASVDLQDIFQVPVAAAKAAATPSPGSLLSLGSAIHNAASIFQAADALPAPASEFVSGGGGHGGVNDAIPGNIGAIFASDLNTFPGTGGGGGGGGGSSFWSLDLAFIPVEVNNATGGGGAGGGGPAGAVRITGGREFQVGPNARLDGQGGRGGLGQANMTTAGSGGGGGGGAGGVAKLQALRFSNRGDIDLSGGERSGALAAVNKSPLAVNAPRKIQAIPGYGGAFMLHGFGNRVQFFWPNARLRKETHLAFLNQIKGLGAGRFFGARYFLAIDEANQVWSCGLPDYFAPGGPTLAPLGSPLANLTADLVRFPANLEVVDIVQSPVAPFNIYVAGNAPINSSQARSYIIEFDAGFSFIGSQSFVVDNLWNNYNAVGFLNSLDFFNDGRMLAAFSTSATETGFIRFDYNLLDFEVLKSSGSRLKSLSVIRDLPKEQVLSVEFSPTIGGGGGPSEPGVHRYGFNTGGTDLEETNHFSFSTATISGPGFAGRARIDGSLPGSQSPTIRFDGVELDDLVWLMPGLSAAPGIRGVGTIGSFSQSATNAPPELDLVTPHTTITAYGNGGLRPMGTSLIQQVKVTPMSGGVSNSADLLPDSDGTFESIHPIGAGFWSVRVETSEDGSLAGPAEPAEEVFGDQLLIRYVLSIPGANQYPPNNGN